MTTTSNTSPELELSYTSDLDSAATVFALDGTSSSQSAIDDFPVDGLTLCCWFRITDGAGDATLWSYTADGRALWVGHPADVEVAFGDASTGPTGVALDDGEWHQLVVAVAPAAEGYYQVQLYKDGCLAFLSQGSLAYAGEGLAAGGDLVLGQGGDGSGLVGEASELELWRGVLDRLAVATGLERRARDGEEGLVLAWALESPDTAGTVSEGAWVESDLRFRQAAVVAASSGGSEGAWDLEIEAIPGGWFWAADELETPEVEVSGVLLNQPYEGRARNSGEEDWGEAAELVPFDLGQVALELVASEADQTLEARWPAVDQAGEYRVSVASGDVGSTEDQSETFYDLTPYLGADDEVVVEVRATASGSAGPANDTPGVAAPDLDFEEIDDGDGGHFELSWELVGDATGYYAEIFLAGDETPLFERLFDAGETACAVSRSEVTPEDGVTYTARLRAAGGAALGPWDEQVLVVQALAAPVVGFAYDEGQDQASAVWQAVSAEGQVDYVVVETRDGAASAPVTVDDTSYPLPGMLQEDALITIEVRAETADQVGPWSQPSDLSAPAVDDLVYDADSSALTVTWEAVEGAESYYAELFADDGSGGAGARLGAEWLDGATLEAAFDLPEAESGDLYHAAVRALGGGTMSAFARGEITVYALVGPTLDPLLADTDSHTLTASWQFDDQGLDDVDYQAELWHGGERVDTHETSEKETTFTSDTIANDATLSVRVRAVLDSSPGNGRSLGAWSQTRTVVAGSDLDQVTGLAVCSDSKGNLTASWNPVTGAETYEISLLPGSGYDGYDRAGISDTQVTLDKSDTGVEKGETYDVRVRATAGTSTGPWSDVEEVEAGKVDTCDPGDDCDDPHTGDPISLARGSFTYTQEGVTVLGRVSLSFVARYNSRRPRPDDDPALPDTPMGARWTHSYNTFLSESADASLLYVVWGDGVINTYAVPASVTGTYTKRGIPNGDTLVRQSDGTYTLTRPDQTRYLFTSSGVLSTIVSAVGNRALLDYDGAGRLTRITDEASGRFLTLGYDADSRVAAVSDNKDRSIAFGYDADANLVSFVDLQGGETAFTYDGHSRILTITDPLGQTFVTNTWDEKDRVVFQQDARAVASGEAYGIGIEYEEQVRDEMEVMQATVSDNQGYVSVFVSDTASGKMLSALYQLEGDDVRKVIRTYDGMSNLLTETVYEGPPEDAGSDQEPVGNTTTYTYDGHRNVLTETDPMGRVSAATYDDANHPLTFTDPLGNTWSFVWEGNELDTLTDPLGRTAVLDYDHEGDIGGLVSAFTDFLGNVTTIDYSDAGDPSTVTDPLGNVTDLTFNQVGRLRMVEVLDPSGERLRWTRLTRRANSQIKQRDVSYAGQPEDDAYSWRYRYNAVAKLERLTDPLGYRTHYSYDPNDLPESVLYPVDGGDPEQVTVNSYDRNDNRTGVAYSADVAVGYGYDPLGRLTSATDGNAQTTEYVYAMLLDAGSPYPSSVTTVYPAVETAAGTERYQSVETRDAADRLIAVTDREGLTTTLTYEAVTGATEGTADLRVVTTLPPADPAASERYTTAVVYDPLGRLVSRTDESGRTWTTEYGTRSEDDGTVSEVVTTTDPLGNQSVDVLDAVGNRIENRIGAADAWRRTAYRYDALHRLTRVEEPQGETVLTTDYAYGYEAQSGLLRATLTPYGQSSSVFSFDGAGRWVEYSDALRGTTLLEHTPRGQLRRYTDARGEALEYRYDAAGRFTTTLVPDGAGGTTEVLQVLDGNGERLETRLDGAPSIQRTFDTLGRMTSRTDPYGNTVGYAYTATGRVSALEYPDGPTVTYGYDGLQRMHTVTDWAGRSAAYSYYPTGELASAELPNGVANAWSFDAAGRLTGVESTVAGELLASSSFELDPFGEPAGSTELLPLPTPAAADSRSFEYADGSDRLSAVDGAAVTYDAAGNMASIPGVEGELVHNALDQLVAVGADRGYDYDPDGLRLDATAGGAVTRFVQDVAGYRSPRVEQADPARRVVGAAPVLTVTGPGALLPQVGPSGTPQPLGAALDRLLATTDAEGVVTARYVYGMGLVAREDAGATGDGYQVYVYDSRGSTLALVSEAGEVTDRYAYDPFGRLINHSGESANPFLYCGRYGAMDDGTGLVFLRARYYDPAILRFVEPDYLFGDLLRPQTLNRYAYVTGNPVQWIDPLGLDKNKGDDDDGSSFWDLFKNTATVLIPIVVGSAGAAATNFFKPADSTGGRPGTPDGGESDDPPPPDEPGTSDSIEMEILSDNAITAEQSRQVPMDRSGLVHLIPSGA